MEKENKNRKLPANPFKYIHKKVCKPGSCKRASKQLGMIFLVVSIFYGLIWVPSERLNLEQAELRLAQQNYVVNLQLAQIGLNKIQNSCQLATSQALSEFEQQNEVELTVEQKQQIANEFFKNCLVAEGLPVSN